LRSNKPNAQPEHPREAPTPVVTYMQDLYGRFTSVSPTVRMALGYSQEEMLRLKMADLVLAEDHALLQRMLRLMFAGTNPPPHHLRLRRKDGGPETMEITTWLVTADDGEPVGLRGIARPAASDASAPVPAEDGAVRRLFDGAPIGLYRTTPSGRVLMVNATLMRWLGYSSLSDLTARNLEVSLEAGYSRAWFREQIERTGEIKGLVSTWTTHDGRRLVMRESATAVHGPDGEVLFYDGALELLEDAEAIPRAG
jgi:PAS domain S-box-containing protein